MGRSGGRAIYISPTLAVGQIVLRLPTWALAENIRKCERAGQPAATAPKSEEQKIVRALPPEAGMLTKLSDLSNQNVRLRLVEAFHSWIVSEKQRHGSGANVDAKKLRWGECLRFARTLDVFRGVKNSVASQRVRLCLKQYQRYGGRYAGNEGLAVSKKGRIPVASEILRGDGATVVAAAPHAPLCGSSFSIGGATCV